MRPAGRLVRLLGPRCGAHVTRLVTVVLVTIWAAGPLLAQERETADPFPHSEHAGLFPLCVGCHGGAETVARDLYPDPRLCVQCHDGLDEERVVWDAPSPRPSNVRYDHLVHAADLQREGEASQSCTSCHAESAELRWNVNTAVLGTCWGCHTHERAEHFADGQCGSCHVPLSASTIQTSQYAAWTAPSDHEIPQFLAIEHGRAALQEGGLESCATCHTRERCTSCHVNGGLEPIPALGFAPSTLSLPRYQATYPIPGSHEIPNWLEDHNTLASLAECGTCHVQQDCASCHVTPVPVAVDGVLRRGQSLAPGVGLERRRPPTHTRPGFAEAHGADAASDDRLCASCHRPTTCVSCHLGGQLDGAPAAGPAGESVARLLAPSGVASLVHQERPAPPQSREGGGAGFHPAAYDLRHAADAWGASLECANCHNTVVFCRSCHIESGLGGEGRLGRGYHDAAGPWIIRHGQAARQALESCASCHRQKECMQCHSTTGGFRVNPHGADFDAELAWEKAKRTCQACHRSDPIGGGS